MGKNETICDVLHEPKNKCKQTLESAQYGLGIKGICVDAVILSWYSMFKDVRAQKLPTHRFF